MRPRSLKTRWLKECGLKYVTLSKCRYVYRPPPYSKEIVLGRESDQRRKIISAYEAVTSGGQGTLKWLLNYYIKNHKKISPRTLQDYERYKDKLLDKKWFGRNGNPQLSTIKRITIRSYLDSYPAPQQANKHVQFIKAAWNYTSQRYDIPANPCAGVTLNESKPRTALWTLKQYDSAFEVAMSMRFPFMAVFMELEYLCGARFGEIQRMKLADVLEDGVHLRRTKGSKDEITLWTARLRKAVDFARTLHSAAPAPIEGSYLVHNKNGSMITESQYKNACRRIKAASKVDLSNVTFHDIKANAATDRPDHDVGHLSDKMKAIYTRMPKMRPATR